MSLTDTVPVWQRGLNVSQLSAVTTSSPYTLVLAGAGSGKTRVLISRLLYLFMEKQLGPFQVLALTFTNKAAGEMRSRLAASFPWSHSVWMGTFHGIAHRLLRLHAADADLPPSFTVIDSEDQQRLCKRILREHEVDEKVLSSRALAHLIAREKDAGRRPADVAAYYGHTPWLPLYESYEAACRAAGLVDFGELLLRSFELLANQPALLAHYQERFCHILVDEFQDTNRLQYRWLKLLAGESSGLFVVGDDDQSIYGWRGAEIANIRNFVSDFAPCELVRLEQNYRSTQRILQAANAVIAHNRGRMGKKLWSAGDQGEAVAHYAAINEFDEARFVLAQLRRWQQQGGLLADAAVLYRSNHQSRVLEQVFKREGMSYQITGGMRFFERAEIKDALSYARLLLNSADDAAFDRVVNVPARGLGEKSLQKVAVLARTQGIGRLEALRQLLLHGGLSGRAREGAAAFLALFERWQALRAGPLDRLMRAIVEDAGLMAFYGQDSVTGEGRRENLEELVVAAGQYELPEDLPAALQGQDPLLMFLAQTALDQDDGADEQADSVRLMTIHAAKGLEFGFVAVVGLEEGVFPTSRSLEDPDGVEEERRLMYVAMTRARRSLLLTSCAMRRFQGHESLMQASRFVREVPAALLQPVGVATQSYKSGSAPVASDVPFPPGTRVVHAKFGEGLVLAVEGDATDGRVQVRFSDASRWLLLSLANLRHWDGCED